MLRRGVCLTCRLDGAPCSRADAFACAHPSLAGALAATYSCVVRHSCLGGRRLNVPSRSAFRHSSHERVPLRPCRHCVSDISCFSPTALWIPSFHVGCPPTSTMYSLSPSFFACDPLSARASLDRWLKQVLRTLLTTNSLPSQAGRLS